MNYLWETSNVQPNLLVAFMQWADEVTAVVYLTTEKRDKMCCVVAFGENSFGQLPVDLVGHYFYKLRKAVCLHQFMCVTSENTKMEHNKWKAHTLFLCRLFCCQYIFLWCVAKKEMMLQHQTVRLHDRTLICF